MDLFVKPEDEFDISIVVGSSKTKKEHIYCNTDEASLKEVAGEDLDTYKTYKIVFRYPTYGDSIKIVDAAVSLSVDSVNLAPGELRMERISTLIKSWNLAEKAPDRTQIESLNPLVANVIGFQLDEALKERGLL